MAFAACMSFCTTAILLFADGAFLLAALLPYSGSGSSRYDGGALAFYVFVDCFFGTALTRGSPDGGALLFSRPAWLMRYAGCPPADH